MSRMNQERVTLTVEGQDFGVWDSFEGGEIASEDTKHREGGMGDEISLGGVSTRGTITIARLYRVERDHPRYKELDRLCRESARCGLVRQKLLPNKAPTGDPVNYTGTLTKVTLPNHDSTSSDKAMFALEISADEAIS